MEPLDRLQKQVLLFLRELPVRRGETIVVALSGGPDSTALLHLVSSLRDELEVRVAAAWMDHGIRPAEERAAERLLVARTTQGLDVPLRTSRVAPGELERIARERGTGLEDAARRRRYAFFKKAARELQAEWVALGHNRDDQLETLIMRFFQGSGTAGLAGMPARRGKIIRPLLSASREEILSFLAEAGIRYHTDSTNRDPRHLRNKVRHLLIPAIHDVFPGFPTALAALSDKMRLEERFLAAVVRERGEWKRWGDGWCMPYRTFAELAPALRIRMLYDLYARLRTGTAGERIPFRFLRPIVHLDPEGKDRILLKGYGAVLEKRGERACFRKDIVQTGEMGYYATLAVGNRYPLNDTVVLSVECGSLLPEEGAAWIRADSARPPLIARSPVPGDRIDIETGRKEVKKLLSEWAVPPNLRSRIPVLEDGNGILAVLGEAYGYRSRFAPRARNGAVPGEAVYRFRFDRKG